MSGAEGIVHKDLGQVSQSLAQLGVVLGLALFKAGVLQQHHLAVLQGGSLGLGILAGNVLGHDNGLAQQLGNAVSHHLQAQLGLDFPLGLAHVGAQNDLGIVVYQVLNGRHGGHDALVGSNLAIFGGNIEVAAAQNALAGYVNILDGLFVVVHIDSSKLPGIVPHFSKILQIGKCQLPQSLVNRDCHRIAEIQTSGFRAHGNADAAFPVLLQKILRQPLCLLSEEQIGTVVKFRFGIAPGRLGRQTPHFPHLVF